MCAEARRHGRSWPRTRLYAVGVPGLPSVGDAQERVAPADDLARRRALTTQEARRAMLLIQSRGAVRHEAGQGRRVQRPSGAVDGLSGIGPHVGATGHHDCGQPLQQVVEERRIERPVASSDDQAAVGMERVLRPSVGLGEVEANGGRRLVAAGGRGEARPSR